MGLCTPPPAGERGRKKGISPVGILLERACRERHLAQKNAKHTSRVTFYAFAQSSILRTDRVLLSLSLSHPNKKFALCASKISSSPSSKRTPKRTTRRETRNATASLLKPIINNAYNYSYLHGCLLSFGIILVICVYYYALICSYFIRKENVVFLWFGRFCFLHRPRVRTKKQQKRGKERQKAWEEDTCHRTCAPQTRQNQLLL